MSSTPVATPERARLREAISRAYRRDEPECVARLAAELRAAGTDPERVRARARALVEAVRHQRRGASGVDHLMQEFSLSSQEGVALMCLAEALLRIPDPATADRLIRDKISKGDWRAHLGASHSVFVNAATWGLMITGKLVSTHSEDALGGAVTRLIGRGGEPLIRRGVDFAMRLLGKQFVMGETIEEALAGSRANEERGYLHSFDMLGEAASTAEDAARYLASYEHAIHAIGKASAGRGPYRGPGISIKLSALHPRYSRSQRERVHAELAPRLKSLARLARGYDIGINIDAEEADRLELSLELLEALAADHELAGWSGLGFVVQAYQKRCPYVIDFIVELARRNARRIMVRLVKGAYWDSEIKRAQVEGHDDYPVFTRKVHTDVSYLACARRLLEASDAVHPKFATHNAYPLAAVYQMAMDRGVGDYEFQCLHGMGEALYDNVVGADQLGKSARIYAPVGTHETLLPYLVRRLLENGANSSFVNRIVDETVTVDQLIADPLEAVARDGAAPHPGIPLPRELYGASRANSAGLDLSDEIGLDLLERALDHLRARRWSAFPVIAGRAARRLPAIVIRNPANHADEVGDACEATVEEARDAVDVAAGFASEWNAGPGEEGAGMLERAAVASRARRNRGRGADRGSTRAWRGLHGLHGSGAPHRQIAWAARRAPHRRDRRAERDDRRLLRARRAGGPGCPRIGVRQRGTALLGLARALPAGRHRRSSARDAEGRDGRARHRRPREPRHRRGAGDRRRGARQPRAPRRGHAGGGEERLPARGAGRGLARDFHAPDPGRDRRHRRARARGIRARGSRAALRGRRARRARRRHQRHGIRPHVRSAHAHRRDGRRGRGARQGRQRLREPQHGGSGGRRAAVRRRGQVRHPSERGRASLSASAARHGECFARGDRLAARRLRGLCAVG